MPPLDDNKSQAAGSVEVSVHSFHHQQADVEACLQRGLVLVPQKKCPSCASSLVMIATSPVKKEQEADKQDESAKTPSMKDATELQQSMLERTPSSSSTRSVVLTIEPHLQPIANLPFCVACQAHVLCHASHLDLLLQTASSNTTLRKVAAQGAIFVEESLANATAAIQGNDVDLQQTESKLLLQRLDMDQVSVTGAPVLDPVQAQEHLVLAQTTSKNTADVDVHSIERLAKMNNKDSLLDEDEDDTMCPREPETHDDPEALLQLLSMGSEDAWDDIEVVHCDDSVLHPTKIVQEHDAVEPMVNVSPEAKSMTQDHQEEMVPETPRTTLSPIPQSQDDTEEDKDEDCDADNHDYIPDDISMDPSTVDYAVRRSLATQILGEKMQLGYQLLEKDCTVCDMPLMADADGPHCVVCPYLMALQAGQSVATSHANKEKVVKEDDKADEATELTVETDDHETIEQAPVKEEVQIQEVQESTLKQADQETLKQATNRDLATTAFDSTHSVTDPIHCDTVSVLPVLQELEDMIPPRVDTGMSTPVAPQVASDTPNTRATSKETSLAQWEVEALQMQQDAEEAMNRARVALERIKKARMLSEARKPATPASPETTGTRALEEPEKVEDLQIVPEMTEAQVEDSLVMPEKNEAQTTNEPETTERALDMNTPEETDRAQITSPQTVVEHDSVGNLNITATMEESSVPGVELEVLPETEAPAGEESAKDNHEVMEATEPQTEFDDKDDEDVPADKELGAPAEDVLPEATSMQDLVSNATFESVNNTWKLLHAEARLVKLRRKVTGWKELSQCCQGPQCQGSSLLKKGNDIECVVCGGTGSGDDGLYAELNYVASFVSDTEMRSIVSAATEEPSTKQPLAKRLISKLKNAVVTKPKKKTIISGGPLSRGIPASQSVTRSVQELQDDFESKRNLVSKEIGKRMTRGWVLLDLACPYCIMPLMTDKHGVDEICVLCGLVGKAGESQSIALSPATTHVDEDTKVGSQECVDTTASTAVVAAEKTDLKEAACMTSPFASVLDEKTVENVVTRTNSGADAPEFPFIPTIVKHHEAGEGVPPTPRDPSPQKQRQTDKRPSPLQLDGTSASNERPPSVDPEPGISRKSEDMDVPSTVVVHEQDHQPKTVHSTTSKSEPFDDGKSPRVLNWFRRAFNSTGSKCDPPALRGQAVAAKPSVDVAESIDGTPTARSLSTPSVNAPIKENQVEAENEIQDSNVERKDDDEEERSNLAEMSAEESRQDDAYATDDYNDIQLPTDIDQDEERSLRSLLRASKKQASETQRALPSPGMAAMNAPNLPMSSPMSMTSTVPLASPESTQQIVRTSSRPRVTPETATRSIKSSRSSSDSSKSSDSFKTGRKAMAKVKQHRQRRIKNKLPSVAASIVPTSHPDVFVIEDSKSVKSTLSNASHNSVGSAALDALMDRIEDAKHKLHQPSTASDGLRSQSQLRELIDNLAKAAEEMERME